MKRMLPLLLCLALLLGGCSVKKSPAIVATTAPVQQFTQAVCAGTGLEVGLIVSDSVSCLHDYTLSVHQMAALERAEVVVLNGCGLESFLDDTLLEGKRCIDSSAAAELLCSGHHGEEEHDGHESHDHHGHDHGAYDPHIWLDPENAARMTRTIAEELSALYPQHAERFRENAEAYCLRLDELKQKGCEALAALSCRELITFHDGFAYLAHGFGLELLASIEEDSGSEASARDLRRITLLVEEHEVPAVFMEVNGSRSAASVIAAETGCGIGVLDTVMSGEDYFTAMEENIRAIREALS